jgi:CBS domain containing-hemolysin-like protein
MTPTLALVVLVLFAGASFFFALAETSLFSLGKWQLRQLEARSPAWAKIISRLLAEPQDLLATLVLGNSFANAGIVAVGPFAGHAPRWPRRRCWRRLLVLILFGGEVAPKALAVRAPELWALRVARLMLFLQKFSRPLRRVAQGLTNLALRAFPQSSCPAGRAFRRRVSGVARNGLSARRAGGRRKGNHPANHQSRPPPRRRRDESASANGLHLRRPLRDRK